MIERRDEAALTVARASFERRDVRVASSTSTWGIAVEAPIEIALNGTPWTVLLGTPADVKDLAIGAALTERVLREASAVHDVTVSEFLHELSVNLIVDESGLDRTALRSRSLLGSTACGLCGIESLAQLQQQLSTRARGDRAPQPRAVTDESLLRAFSALDDHQPVNRATHSVHAAAWCTPSGNIELAREDVGRHNALDKLIGAIAQRDGLAHDGFVVMSSRCSYELVYKTAFTNARCLATISAPTSMALEWGEALDVPLMCRAGTGIVRFPMRVEAADATR